MRFQSYVLSLLAGAFVQQCAAQDGHGLVGYGIKMYNPVCADTCSGTFQACTLACTPTDMMDMGGMMMTMTPPDCYAQDDSYLTSVAWCVNQYCSDIPMYKLEYWWAHHAIGANLDIYPKWTYQEALAQIKTPPSVTIHSGDPLNQTALMNKDDWTALWNAQAIYMETSEVRTSRFRYVVDRCCYPANVVQHHPRCDYDWNPDCVHRARLFTP